MRSSYAGLSSVAAVGLLYRMGDITSPHLKSGAAGPRIHGRDCETLAMHGWQLKIVDQKSGAETMRAKSRTGTRRLGSGFPSACYCRRGVCVIGGLGQGGPTG